MFSRTIVLHAFIPLFCRPIVACGDDARSDAGRKRAYGRWWHARSLVKMCEETLAEIAETADYTRKAAFLATCGGSMELPRPC